MVDWNELRRGMDNMMRDKFPKLANEWHFDGLGNSLMVVIQEHFIEERVRDATRKEDKDD